jgi:hypothetical protein
MFYVRQPRNHAKSLIGLLLSLAICANLVIWPLPTPGRAAPVRKAAASAPDQARHPKPAKGAPGNPRLISSAPARSQPATTRASEAFGKLPLSFESNQGQADSRIKFLSHGAGYGLYLTGTEATFLLRKQATKKSVPARQTAARASRSHTPKMISAVTMKLAEANSKAEVEGLDRLTGVSNYFIGKDPAQWRLDVPHYGRVKVHNVYPGIDMIYSGHGRQLEYDLVVAPGADPGAIRLEFAGTRKLQIDSRGDLLVKSRSGDILMRSPNIYQESNGKKDLVQGSFVRSGKKQVAFHVEEYDRSKPLVIDPAVLLSYSTFLGGSDQDFGEAVAVDADGNAYITGQTYSTNFPTQNPFQPTFSGGGSPFAYDAFVSKLSADGSALVYSTYLGGSDNTEEGHSIAVDPAGNAYVMGLTKSNNFPTTANALQMTGQSNVLQNFVSKLGPSGSSLLYSTYLGTSSTALNGVTVGGIAVDAAGSAYVTGTTLSASFPILNGFQTALFAGAQSAFVTRLNTNASGAQSLVYSSYLGGSTFSYGYSIAADASGNAYVSGLTASPNFPTKNGFQPNISSNSGIQLDAFMAKIDTNSSGSNSLAYSTYLGGTGVEFEAYVAADQAGHAYVAGTTSSTDFPTKNPYQAANLGGSNAFAMKVDTQLSGASSLIYSTYLGGNGSDSAKGIVVDAGGNAYLAGSNSSNNFPQVNPLSLPGGGNSSFVTKFNSDGSDLIYSTYFPSSVFGMALDSTGNVYVTGVTDGSTFPITTGVFQSQVGGDVDAFITKLSFTEATGLTISSITPNTGGNTGFATVTIKGTGFVSGATAKLTAPGQPDIIGDPVTVRTDGRAVTARFDLHGVAPGIWDVTVTNPDATTVTAAGGFTVEAGGGPNVWVDLVGRTAVRSGREEGFVVFFGNSGDTDALGVPLTITGIPLSADVKLDFTLNPTALPAAYEQYRTDDISPIVQTDTEQVIPLFVGVIPAGSTRSFRIFVTAHQQSLTQFTLNATIGDPFYGSPLKPTPQDCYKKVAIEVIKDVATRLLKKFIPGVECSEALLLAYADITKASVDAAGSANQGGLDAAGGISATSSMLAPALKATVTCAEQAVGIIVPEIGVTIFVLETIPRIYTLYQIINTCGPTIFGGGARSSSLTVGLVASGDPNDKVGARGFGPAQYIAGDQPLRYAIFFENLATATAPAQTVVINDPLDPTKFDLSTFSLGVISFGSTVVIPPAGVSSYSTDVDLRPGNNLIARVNASLDPSTGFVTWRIDSIDPGTGQPTTDPLAGFLPPDQTPPAGEGYVTFNVMPQTQLITGDKIQNQATIIFDNNAPINTPVWSNTLDKTKPVSQVAPLPAQEGLANFIVQWSGNDPDSGIAGFNIYVSENGGPYNIWLRNAAGTSALFEGQPFTTYSFYSIAQDNAQNLEDSKINAEATTTTPSSASQFSTDTYNVMKNAGNATITVTRMGDTSHAATVDYATHDATALSGHDYTGVSGTLSFTAGQTSQNFNVPIIDNSVVDGDRSFVITLGNPTGDVISSPDTATVNILDDDQFGDTAAGSPVTVRMGNVTVTYTQITSSGSSAAEPIDPNAQGSAPNSYNIIGPAYDISTNAGYSGPVRVCFELDGITDQATFSHLTVLHSENGVLVDRTTGQNFGTHTLCGSVSSLSPFVIAKGPQPTAAPGSISGVITTGDGSPLAGVVLTLSGGAQSTAITDSSGHYSFGTLELGNFYNITPWLANYTFNPANRSLSLLGSRTDATFTANADSLVSANAIDTTGYFIRQQYLDFLGREPDQDGWEYWTGQIDQCQGNAECIPNQRIDVSAAFFASPEFQQTGSYIYDLYAGALARTPRYEEFMSDRGQVVGGPNLAGSKVTFANAFIQRSEFTARYPQSMSRDEFIDALLRTMTSRSGADLSSIRGTMESDYEAGGRSLVVRDAVTAAVFSQAEYNKAFVLMEYFGYLRRDTDQNGYEFWLNVLNNGSLNNYRGMVCSFITSTEYQLRFGTVVTQSNSECQR